MFAKHKNGRFYGGHVAEIKEQLFCEIDFDDGSYSKDMYPEDIHVSDQRQGTLLLVCFGGKMKCTGGKEPPTLGKIVARLFHPFEK